MQRPGTRPGGGGAGVQRPGNIRPGVANRPGFDNRAGGYGNRNFGDRNLGIGNRAAIGNRNNVFANSGNINAGNRANLNRTTNVNANFNRANVNAFHGGIGQAGWSGAWRNGYYHGYRNGYYNGWYHPWVNGGWNYWRGGYPFGWGAAAIGAAAALGGPAYYEPAVVYSNPYYIAPETPVATGLDYSQPLPPPLQVTVNAAPTNSVTVAPDDGTGSAPDAPPAVDEPPPPPANVPPQAMKDFDAARESFKAGKYEEALDRVNKAIALLPSDATLHEFRALTLFALKKYREAAASIYAVLSTGPGWNWATVAELYADPKTYTEQFRALEAYQRGNPEDAAAAFLLAYHDLVIGQPDAAARQLEKVVKLQPKDQVSATLLKSLRKPEGEAPAPQQ